VAARWVALGLPACARADTIQRMTASGSGLPSNIGAPATRALTAAGYTELRQLSQIPAGELKKLHGVGPKALKLLQEALERQGLSLGSLSARRLRMTSSHYGRSRLAAKSSVLQAHAGGRVLGLFGGGDGRRGLRSGRGPSAASW